MTGSYLLSVIILTLIVFLLVFFLSWWGKIHLISCFALASAIAFLFMVILYPPIQIGTDFSTTANNVGLVITYWIIYALFVFYIFVYVIYKSVTDPAPGQKVTKKRVVRVKKTVTEPSFEDLSSSSRSEVSEELLF